jgi:hypothetical protein
MFKVRAVLRTAVMARVVERLQLVGLYEFITFPVTQPPFSECLEWWGDDREADWVVRALRAVNVGVGAREGTAWLVRLDLAIDVPGLPVAV